MVTYTTPRQRQKQQQRPEDNDDDDDESKRSMQTTRSNSDDDDLEDSSSSYRMSDSRDFCRDNNNDDDDDRTNLLGKPNPRTQTKTVSWSELPQWMQDNIYITAGYRRPTGSYTKCIQSLFYLHNESVNIWSHLLGFILFLGLAIHFVWQQPFADSLTAADYIYFFCFIAGAMVCLGFSSSFHCFSCHSEPVAAQWNRCDYAGIVTLTVGSFYPLLYYGFHCHPTLQIIYLVIITILGSLTAAVALLKHFRTPAYRWMRTGLFLALGLFGIVPTLHGVIIYGFGNSADTISLWNLVLMAVAYVGGALIYGCRIPERWYPGSFNIWFASHQIFHVCVLIAVTSHYIGVMRAMAFWHQKDNPLCAQFI
ncbi:hemolysin-III related-domain-containing protein [Zychaea mexicana]|uniref:hemolysin-III related-domain-containing protein n=1 Tax=Zychaea mexicana TaxID=64656 RepID=UPI0022FEA77F|nr:hemolysin-III related-domain-containing protein [Zychaea mexicana]KAI9490337.1 hemolysin-III related-domain-containing protein [Zychaea mexicana]